MIGRLFRVLGWIAAIVFIPYLTGWVRMKYKLNLLPGLYLGEDNIDLWLTGLAILWLSAAVIVVIFWAEEGFKWLYKYIRYGEK